MKKSDLLERFLDISQEYSSSCALQTSVEELSYGELKSQIASVGHFFKDIGVLPGDRVVLVVDNSINYIIAFYAIWKAGAVVVPLNPQARFHEVLKAVRQSKACCLLLDKVTPQLIEQSNKDNVSLVSLEKVSFDKDCTNNIYHWNDALKASSDDDWYKHDSDSLAQIIYTSGTTGDPKGVMLTHGNLACNVQDIVDYLQLTRLDSVLNVLPFHYSYGNSVLHTHLFVGAKIILAGSMAYPQEIVNTLRTSEASGFYGVPSTYSLLLSRSDWSDNPPALRYMTQAGGPMGASLTTELLQACHQSTLLFVMYGQTEASARLTWLPPERLTDKLGSVGIPVAQVELEIRDEKGNRLEHSNIGEVYARGPGIMQGYWDNPSATATTLGGGWLKTGDSGYFDHEGFLFLKGRNSEMIKVGAHRINPLELEEVINKLDFISESAVIGVDDEFLGQKLRVFIVGSESRENLFALKKHCNEFLPPHKIPREIMWRDRLPKTASGKIKRFEIK